MIRLYGVPESDDGAVYIVPKDKGTPQVEIGFNGDWCEVLGTLLHETYELMLIDVNTRWKQDPAYSESAAQFLFVASHEQLGEIHERVGFFLAAAVPDIQLAHRKYENKIKKRKK